MGLETYFTWSSKTTFSVSNDMYSYTKAISSVVTIKISFGSQPLFKTIFDVVAKCLWKFKKT
jgi:hypothetical protein